MAKEIIIYSALFLFLITGTFFKGKIRNFKEYALGVKPFSKLALSSTVVATALGGGSTIGSVAQVHETGVIFMLMLMSVPISFLLFSYLIPKIINYHGCISMPEMMSKMYGGNTKIRRYMAIISFVFLLGALAVQVKSLSSFFTNIFGYNGEISAIVSFLVIVLYTSTKGVTGVIKTDVLQFIIFIIILPIITILLLKNNGSSIENLIYSVPQESFKKNISWASIIAITIGFCLPDDTPDFIHRFLLTKDKNKLTSAINLLSLITVLSTIMVIIIGAVGLIKYPNEDSNQIIFIVIRDLLSNEILYSLFGVGLLAVIMSTADSLINTASVIFVHDIILKSQGRKGLLFARIACIAAGLLAVIVALKSNTIFGIILFFSQLFTSAVFVPFVFGLFRPNKRSIMFWSSSLLGITSYIIVYLLPYEFEEATFLISLSVSAMSYIIFSEKPLKFIVNRVKLLFYIKNVNQKIRINQLGYTLLPISLWLIATGIADNNFSLIELSIIVIDIILIFFELIFPEKKGNALYYLSFWYTFPFFSMCLYFQNSNAIFFPFHFAITMTLLMIYYRWDRIILRLMLCCFAGFFAVMIFNQGTINTLSFQITQLLLMLLYICASSVIFFKKNDEMLEGMQIMGGMIAHEMRSPLSSIAGNLKLLKNEENENLVSRNLNIIKRAQNNVETFIANLKQNYNIILEPTHINQLVNEILDEYGLTEEELEVIKYKESNIDYLIKVDKFLVKQVVTNLLKNGLYQRKKYKKGIIKIDIVDNNKLIVYDNIIGIEEKFIPYIFYNFTTTNKNGSGLGLSFCKYAMEKMNGDIICESEIFKYTKFTLTFSQNE
jgi:Na+/proline symporter